MFGELFDTPLKSAALGIGIVALWILALSQSDLLLRIFDRTSTLEERDARRLRFRNYALTLLVISICMVVGSNLIQRT